MVGRAVTRALAGDVEGAKVMLERKRESKMRREVIAAEKVRRVIHNDTPFWFGFLNSSF